MDDYANDILPGFITKVRPVLEELEEQRKHNLKKTAFLTVSIAILTSIVVLFIPTSAKFYAVAFSVFLIFLSMLISSSFGRRELDSKYKELVVKKMVEQVNDENIACEYSRNGCANIDTFRRSSLFSQHPSERLSSEDSFCGRVGNSAFAFCEAKYSYCEECQDKEREKEVVLFQGIQFEADFNKNFNGKTLVTHFCPEGVSYSRFKKVKNLENTEFCKKFSVYSTNDIEARYILSPALQERILSLNDSFVSNSITRNHLKISFFENRIFILIPSSKNNFEASFFKRMDETRVGSDYRVITSLISIIEELNLNTRIWTKE